MADNRKEIMNDSLNPFDRVTENPEYPMARIYRESFWMGLADTYDVIVGNHFRWSYKEETHAGVLDVLVFPIISQWLMRIAFPTAKNFTYEEPPKEYRREILNSTHKDGSKNYSVYYENPDAAPMPIRLFAGALALLLEAPRVLIGVLLTLVVSPVVAVVHLASLYKANKLKQEVQDLQIDQTGRYRNSSTTTMRDFLHHEYASGSYDESLTAISADTEIQSVQTYTIDRDGKFERSFVVPENNNDTAEQAFYELNVGGRKYR